MEKDRQITDHRYNELKTEKNINEKIEKIAVLHPVFSLGGATAVAVWTIEALKDEYDLTIVTTAPMDFKKINDFYGAGLAGGDFDIRIIPGSPFLRKILPAGFLFKVHLVQNYYKRHRDEFNLAISTRCEMDLGERGIQYIHFPVWNDEQIRRIGQMPDRLIHKNNLVRKIYRGACTLLSGWKEEGIKGNLTLVNSGWTGERVKEAYGIESRIVYPPVPDDFPDFPWEEREDGFVCIGTVAPGKKVEAMIEIIERVRVSMPTVHLHIIGNCNNPEYMKKIDRLCAGRSDWLVWEKNLSRKQLVALVSRHKYGIHAMANEHFGIAVAELVKAGCIPFVPGSGGQIEIVGDKRLMYESIEDAAGKIIATIGDLPGHDEIREQLKRKNEVLSTKTFTHAIRGIVRDFRDNTCTARSS